MFTVWQYLQMNFACGSRVAWLVSAALVSTSCGGTGSTTDAAADAASDASGTVDSAVPLDAPAADGMADVSLPSPLSVDVVAAADAEAGSTVEFSCRVGGGSLPADLSYAWSVDGAPVDGEATARLVLPESEGDITIKCTVTDSLGRMASSEIVIPVLVRQSMLVARFPFDGDTLDASGNGHDAVTDDPQFRNQHAGAESGRSLYHILPDRVVVPHAAALSLTTYSITMWVRPELTELGTRTLISKAPEGDYGNYTLYMNSSDGSPSRALNFVHDTEAGLFGTLATNGGIYRDEWTHLAVVLQPDATLVSYVNGVRTVSRADVGVPLTNEGDLRIGYGPRGAFVGRIDEVRIYAEALAEADVMTVYESPY